jgi:hypothetical protein
MAFVEHFVVLPLITAVAALFSVFFIPLFYAQIALERIVWWGCELSQCGHITLDAIEAMYKDTQDGQCLLLAVENCGDFLYRLQHFTAILYAVCLVMFVLLLLFSPETRRGLCTFLWRTDQGRFLCGLYVFLASAIFRFL